MKALIFDNKVIQLEQDTFPVADTLTWMDAPDGCEVGWVLLDGQLQPKPEPEKTQEQLIAMYQESLQQKIDTKAQEKTYANGYACASYANSTNATWQQEATDFIAWRDSCWQYALEIKEQVENGEIEPPTLEEFIANAPTLTWN